MKIYVLVVLLFLSFVTGSLLVDKNKLEKINFENLALSIIYGFILIISFYELLYIIFFLLNMQLRTLNMAYTICVLLASAFGLYRIIKRTKKIEYNFRDIGKLNIVLTMFFICIIFSQLYFLKNYCFYYGYANDEYLYAATTSLALFSNKIITSSGNEIRLMYDAHYSLCCWEIWISWICWFFNLDVSEALHLYVAIYVLLLVYIVYILISIRVFNDYTKRIIFLIISAFLTWYAYYNWISLSGQIIGTPWYGRSAMLVIIIPFLLYLAMLSNLSKNDLMIINLTAFCGCSISMTGMIVIGFLLGCLFLTFLVLKEYKKSIKIITCEFSPILFLLVFLITR